MEYARRASLLYTHYTKVGRQIPSPSQTGVLTVLLYLLGVTRRKETAGGSLSPGRGDQATSRSFYTRGSTFAVPKECLSSMRCRLDLEIGAHPQSPGPSSSRGPSFAAHPHQLPSSAPLQPGDPGFPCASNVTAAQVICTCGILCPGYLHMWNPVEISFLPF